MNAASNLLVVLSIFDKFMDLNHCTCTRIFKIYKCPYV